MSLNIFNLGAKKNSNAIGIEEGVHFKVLKDGHGIEHKILNFENEDICPRIGIIELEPMRRSWAHNKTRLRHENNTFFKRITDREWGVVVGIPIGIDSKTKDIIWKKIIIEDGEILDLTIADDAMKWACVRRSPFFTDKRIVNGEEVEMNPNYSGHSKSSYKAIDRERSSETFLIQRRTKKKASDIAEMLVGHELENYARNCGISPNGMSPVALSVEVIKFAESKPDEFMAIHNSDTKVELTVYNKAVSLGLITTHFENGILYNGITLGFSMPEALKYLKDHPQQLASINAIATQNDKETEISMGTAKKLDADDANAEVARLRKELANKELLLQKTSEKALELQTLKDVTAIDPEFAELMIEAKRLDVKGCHNIKQKEKLKAKIAEKMAQIKN